MPTNILIGLVALFVALIMYTLGALGAFRAKAITRRHVTYIWIGLIFDIVATAMMAIEAGGLDLEPLPDLMHTIVAFVGLFGMLAAAIVGGRAVSRGDDSLRAAVAKWVLAPWVVWVFVFLWGMAARGSQRMG